MPSTVHAIRADSSAVGSRQRRTAYHEAGHAAVGLHLGNTVNGATIEPSGSALGTTTVPHPIYGYYLKSSERRSAVRDAVRQWYAGLAAEHVFCGTPFSFDDDAEHGAWGDHDCARRIWYENCIWRSEEKYAREMRKMQREAITLVRLLADPIHAIAVALLEKQTLGEEELRRMYELAGGDYE